MSVNEQSNRPKSEGKQIDNNKPPLFKEPPSSNVQKVSKQKEINELKPENIIKNKENFIQMISEMEDIVYFSIFLL